MNQDVPFLCDYKQLIDLFSVNQLLCMLVDARFTLSERTLFSWKECFSYDDCYDYTEMCRYVKENAVGLRGIKRGGCVFKAESRDPCERIPAIAQKKLIRIMQEG